MKARRTSLLLVAGVLGALLLTGCVDVEQMDQNWLNRAFLDISDRFDTSWFNWIYLLVIPCMIFAAKAFISADWISFTHWFLIMVLGIGSFFRITEVIVIFGRKLWPDGYTISIVMGWFGWSLPFPEDATWVSPVAYGFTDLIPSLYNTWQWGLLVIHGAMLVIVALSRNTKPLVVDGAFILTWGISPSILAFFTVAIAGAKEQAESALTKAILEVVYIIGGLGTMAIFFWLIPLAVGLVAIFLPWPRPLEYSWGRKDKEAGITRRLRDRIDIDALWAALATLLVQVPPPKRAGNTAYSEVALEQVLLPPPSDVVEGTYREKGPDDFGPSSPRSLTPEPSASPVSERSSRALEGEVKSPQVDVKDDLFEPRKSSLITPAPEEDRSFSTEDEPQESKEEPESGNGEFSTRKGRLTQGLETAGKVAKVAGPLITPVKPEVGLALTAAGELLDRNDEEFPTRKGKSTAPEAPSSRDKPEDEDEELFPPRKGG